ncbi:universal stress protein [Paractinoplanes durhamensis]|uniref:UspA domain-containing protein n=1 Tax=Paractinoplanes durhamensis TaxID=113563 RepID=A0ABQ3YS57_9ACTN|nr:universal stress protein [Actinoplanes durhamensis]GIE00209.1 hypothetical protein Adu01nite_15590 [Actinoplanes durhamensis]
MNVPAVVAGTAGDVSGTVVVEWAAAEARHRRRPLRIVHVLEWHSRPDHGPGAGTHVERVWSASVAMLGLAAERARAIAPDLDIRADTLVGHPADRLLDLARDAELVVVGHRGSGQFAGLRLGSVSGRVAKHAPGPVAVVRGRAQADGPVVAGVDGSEAAGQVLGVAFAAAAARAARLIVLRAFGRSVQIWVSAIHAGGIPAPETDEPRLERLEHLIAPWREKFPQVPAECLVTGESSAAALIAASSEAQLVVVGSHGPGFLRGASLGSTGNQLLQHADCPVLLARPQRGRDLGPGY